MILSPGGRLDLAGAFPQRPRATGAAGVSPTQAGESLEDFERTHILRVLLDCGWKVRGSDGAAERLGLKRTTLQSRMKKLGIRRPKT